MNKIIFINRFYRPDHSATAQLLTDLAQTLAADGRRVSIVTSRQTYDNATADLPAMQVLDGVAIHRVWTSRFGRARLAGRAIDYISFYFSAFMWLLLHADRGDTLIAKTDPPLISLAAAVAARIKGATLINWLQDVFPEVASRLGLVDSKSAMYALLRSVRNWALRSAKVNIVIGDRMAQQIQQNFRYPISTAVIHNWSIQTPLSDEQKFDNPLRGEWRLAGKFVVGYSGNLGRAHEFQTILEAAKLLHDHDDIVFLFVGAGAQLTPVREFSEHNQLCNIVFKPYQPIEKLACSLAVADAHLVSLQVDLEGLIVPSKFYGIIAVERPVVFIGSPQGELAKLIAEHACGNSINPGDSKTLADYILTLRDNKPIWSAASAASGRLANAQLNRGTSLAQWRAIFS